MGQNQPLFIDIGQGLALMIGLSTISSWKSSNRPKNVKRGTIGFNLQTSALEYWDGSSWFQAPMREA